MHNFKMVRFRKQKQQARESGDPIGDLPVYLFGSHGLESMLTEAGVESFGAGPDPIDEGFMGGAGLMDVDVSRKIFAVVCSFDSHISYVKIMKAVNYLKVGAHQKELLSKIGLSCCSGSSSQIYCVQRRYDLSGQCARRNHSWCWERQRCFEGSLPLNSRL